MGKSNMIGQKALHTITHWVCRLWQEIEVSGRMVSKLLTETYNTQASADKYIQSISATVPAMEERLQDLRQVMDENDVCHIWQVTWDLGRDVGDHQIVGKEVLIYHAPTRTIARFAGDTDDGIPIWYQDKLPSTQQFHVHDIVAAWLAASAEWWTYCIE